VEAVVSRRTFWIFFVVLPLVAGTPALARAQASTGSATDPAADPAAPHKTWIVLGGTATTLRGDCQEDCEAHGTGSYLHTGGIFAVVGARLNQRMDAGFEMTWVPAESKSGEDVRSTFLMGAAEFRPWAAHGFFLKAGIGMAFVRNLPYDPSGTLPSARSKGLGVSYGAGWTVRASQRVGVQVFGAQHVAAIGDLQVNGATIDNIIANYWSLGAAIVIR
jgi:hypothetical protein